MSAIGQEVENLFMSQYAHYTSIQDPFDYDATKNAIARWDAVIYQPVFGFENIYVRCDVLVKNTLGTYDLIEIKSKNSIRSKAQHASLNDDLLYDISFQKYILYMVLGSKFSGKVSIVHTNKEYVKNGEVCIQDLLIVDECSTDLLPDEDIASMVSTLSRDLSLNESSFDEKYPYTWENPLLYFAKKMPSDTIFSIKSRYRIKPLIVDRYMSWKTLISSLSDEDIEQVSEYNGSWKTIAAYIKNMKKWHVDINIPMIRSSLWTLEYPLCFYDYETVSTPVPLFDGYHPWQQIVVQYSMHIVYADGSIEHRQSIVDPWTQTNAPVIDAFVRDVGEWFGTYIVRNKSFENWRNSDISLLYPHYAATFDAVNKRTYDLMDIFKNDFYFHPDFAGSASIKKVLPILTNISYEALPIADWATAADILQKLITWNIPESDISMQLDSLSRYCFLDTWAMVCIRKELQSL